MSATTVVPARIAELPQFDRPNRLSSRGQSGTIPVRRIAFAGELVGILLELREAAVPCPTLGKVLLFLNLLAAGGLRLFRRAGLVARRQEIKRYVVLRFQLTLQGLPIESPKLSDNDKDDATVPVEVKSASGMTIEKMSQKLMKTYFTGADGGDIYGGGGSPRPLSLLDELNRAERTHSRIEVDKQQGDAGQSCKILGGLATLADSSQPGVLMNDGRELRTEPRGGAGTRAIRTPQTQERWKRRTSPMRWRRLRDSGRSTALKNPPDPAKLRRTSTKMNRRT